MWDGITTDITATKVAEIRIKQSEQQLRQLSSHVETLKEDERARVSREIHDDLGGTLTAIKMDLMSFASRLPQRSKGLSTKIAGIDRLVDHAIEASVRISAGLRPGILDCGIVAAINGKPANSGTHRDQMQDSRHRGRNHTESDASIAVFRIFQETLTNISKHASASVINIELKQVDGLFLLEVSDNGRGIRDVDRSKPSSFGIRGMLERSRELNGQIKISGVPGHGTKVSLCVPLGSQDASNQEFEHQHRLF